MQHVVLSSVLHAMITDLVQHEIKRDLEEHLVSSGLEFTILQPANYVLRHRLVSAFGDGACRLSWGLDRRRSMVDVGDVAGRSRRLPQSRPRVEDLSWFPCQTRVLRVIGQRHSSHDFVVNPNVLRWLLGRDPTTFEQFVQREVDVS